MGRTVCGRCGESLGDGAMVAITRKNLEFILKGTHEAEDRCDKALKELAALKAVRATPDAQRGIVWGTA